MTVYAALYRWSTPDSDGAEILGVFQNADKARETIVAAAAKVREEYGDDFWEDDMTWDDPTDIQLGHDEHGYFEPATIYAWQIVEQDIQ